MRHTRKKPAIIIIRKDYAGTYRADASGCFSGGYHNARPGQDAHSLIAWVIREIWRYGIGNAAGWVVILPPEIEAAWHERMGNSGIPLTCLDPRKLTHTIEAA